MGLNPEEEREIEAKVKKEQDAGFDAENLYAGIANGIPNEGDKSGNRDALNANFIQGEVRGGHDVNINSQTDLELGGLEDPGGIDPVADRKYLENMKKNIKRNK